MENVPEVSVVQPNKQEQEEERKTVPQEDQVNPEVDPQHKRLHCAEQSPLDRFYHDTFDTSLNPTIQDTHLEAKPCVMESQIPATERYKAPMKDARLEAKPCEELVQTPATERYKAPMMHVDPIPCVLRVGRPAMERYKMGLPQPTKLRAVQEEVIIPEKNTQYFRQKDLQDVGDRMSLKYRLRFERDMDDKLEAGDFDEISDWVTPYKLTQCAKNCLEKSFEVSYKLKCLANSKGPDADDFDALATSVEDFAVQLLEPLKSDDMKRAIFDGDDFDRVSDKAVKYHQKKFLSHPVVYNLMRCQWTGCFSHLRYGNGEKTAQFKWVLLNIWTFIDIFLFPVLFPLLYLMHLLIGLATKTQDVRVVFIFNASWKYADAQFKEMRRISKDIMCQLHSEEVQYATVTRGGDGPIVNQFATSKDAIKRMPNNLDVESTRKQNNDDVQERRTFLNYLKEAEGLFKETKEVCNKVVVVMTDDTFGVPSGELLTAVTSLREQQIKVVSVGFGVHPEIKELEIMATNDENFVLISNNESSTDETKSPDIRILKCIKGKDIFDRYVQYFGTPYFIFFRDTLSYLALLCLHFAMCLQPSTLHFTAIEWIIAVFFLGRFMMEINQVVTEKDWTEMNDIWQEAPSLKTATANEEQKCTSLNPEKEDEPSNVNVKPKQNNKRKSKSQILWRTLLNYFDDWWNILDVVTLVIFLTLVGFRVFIWSEHTSVSKNRLLAVAGYLYGLNTMFLTLRVFGHIMESKKSTGSIQIALFQIIGAVIAIFGQFLAATLAFSLAITKIYIAEVSYNSGSNGTSSWLCKSQNGIDCWWSSTTHLAWSLLGIADLEPLNSPDDTSDILVKLLYGLFLIMGVVMLMNMMIALLSNTYQNVEDNAFYEWSYKKASTIRTYSKYHPVPVPFNVISLSFKLLQHIYRTINCTRCNRSRHVAMLPITATTQPTIEMFEFNKNKSNEKKETNKSNENEEETLFDCLIIDLQALYFAACGYAFPLADDNKMDRLLEETEGSRQLMGHIAQRVFRYDQNETQRLQSHGSPEWETKGIEVFGQRLVHDTCKCRQCVDNGENKHHGAKYLNPLSKEYPEFEVLIQENGERRFIAIGVVTRNYEIHKFPGWEGNTAGYHIDDGKIFDSDKAELGRDGDDAMAYRGDLIGCKILYEKQTETKLPVAFSRNGRVIGEANLTSHKGFPSGPFYPYVGTGCKGISLLFRMSQIDQEMRHEVSFSNTNSEPLMRMLVQMSESLQNIYKSQAMKFQLIYEKQAELERKIDLLSKS